MLRTRLYLGLLPLLLVLVGMGAYAIRVSRELAGAVQHDLVNNYRDILACEQMRTSARLMSAALTQALNGKLIEARREFESNRADFTRALMAQSATSAGTPRAALVQQLDNAFSDWTQLSEARLSGPGAGSLEQIRSNETALFRVLDTIENLNRRDFAAVRQTAERAGHLLASTERVLFAAMAGAVVLSLVIAWRLAASLLRPIQALTASAVAVGEGDLERNVPDLSRDELGQLARAFNQMAVKLRAYRDATVAKVMRTQRTMEATLTSAPDPVFVVWRDGTQEVRNPAADELAGLPDFAAGLPAPLAAPLARVLSTGEHYLPTDYARVITLRVGREDRHYLPRILAIGDALTEFKGAAVVLQDVTKFRLLDDAKTNLVGTVSHELKTPLTSLRMAVYLLLEQRIGPLGAPQRELLEGARDDADRLLRILDNLLDLARLEAGAAALTKRDTPVDALVSEMAAEGRSLLAAAGRELAVSCAREVGQISLNVDVERLRHVFINLLTNAAKYAPPGSVVALSATAPDPEHVRFAVHDSGPGMPAETVAHVFDRFYRAPGQATGGAGLGLAIAREIVVAHGGTIACASEPGRGTEFSFLLPR